jgi:hypothetical protein
MVREVPPADDGMLNGSVMNYWQAAIEDIGPAGVDAGRGGMYAILPPGWDQSLPDAYLRLRSDTFHTYALIRSVPAGGSEEEVARAVAYSRRIQLYPLSQSHHRPATEWVDVSNTLFDAVIPYDLRFFQTLDRIIQLEPWLERDRVMIDQLRSVGIERGKAFRPDANRQATLTRAIEEAHEWLEAAYVNAFPAFSPPRRWGYPRAQNSSEASRPPLANRPPMPWMPAALRTRTRFSVPDTLEEGSST